jgi:hypothetical protein
MDRDSSNEPSKRLDTDDDDDDDGAFLPQHVHAHVQRLTFKLVYNEVVRECDPGTIL